MILWRNIEKYHFLFFLFQPQIFPIVTICKVQIWGNFCTEMFRDDRGYLPIHYTVNFTVVKSNVELEKCDIF